MARPQVAVGGNSLQLKSQSQSQSYLTTDGQSASLSWCQATIRVRDQFLFLLEIFLRQLQGCYFVAPSLTRGRVCNLFLLLVLASAVPLWSESHGTQDHILLSQFLRLPNLEGQAPVFISPRNKVAQLYPRALDSLSVASYDSQGCGGGILTRIHTGKPPATECSCEYIE
jgi:hypothetical protein